VNAATSVRTKLAQLEKFQEINVTKGGLNVKKSKWKFPENPKDLLKELPRDAKGHIYPSNNLRIRPEKHSLNLGEIYSPRHHGQHYHIETRFDPS